METIAIVVIAVAYIMLLIILLVTVCSTSSSTEVIIDEFVDAVRYKRVIVIPAGRQIYMEVLMKHIRAQKSHNSHCFDSLEIWMNTTNNADLAYFKTLQKDHWVTLVECPVPVNGNGSIYSFFKKCVDRDTVYLRLDDDVVWLEHDFIDRMFKFRIDHPSYFLVYGNIINNAVVSYLHQRHGKIGYDRGIVSYSSWDAVGWEDGGSFAEYLHRAFIKSIDEKTTEAWKFGTWELCDNERVSINCISWFGAEFAKFDGEVGTEEEQWLASDGPKSFSKMNAIYGDAICAHFAFYTQRQHLDGTDLLKLYDRLAPK